MMSKIDAARVNAIHRYLEHSFTGASLRFAIGKRTGRPDCYTYLVETNVDTYTLIMSHELLQGDAGSIEEYLLRHDVAGALRQAGAARVIMTTLGLCTESPRQTEPLGNRLARTRLARAS